MSSELKKALIGMAELFGHGLTPVGLEFMARELIDLPEAAVIGAITRIARIERRFPTLAEIRRAANPSEAIGIEQEAVEVSNRIVQAMGRFGYLNPDGAKEFVGSLGWLVVEREGGWQSLCQRTSVDELPILKAQWRELAKALRARADANLLDRPPELLTSSQVTRALENA